MSLGPGVLGPDKETMLKAVRIMAQIGLLALFQLLGLRLAAVAHLPIPGNVLGLLLLFLALQSGLVQLKHIQEGADFLLRCLCFATGSCCAAMRPRSSLASASAPSLRC